MRLFCGADWRSAWQVGKPAPRIPHKWKSHKTTSGIRLRNPQDKCTNKSLENFGIPYSQGFYSLTAFGR